MHSIDILAPGRVAGWLAPSLDGRPGLVIAERKGLRVGVFATLSRPDVLAAGYALLCGFDVGLSSGGDSGPCSITIGDKVCEVVPNKMADAALIVLEGGDARTATGWIRRTTGLRSLSFHHDRGVARAELLHRADVNAHTGAPPDAKLGFRVAGLNVSEIFALNIDNDQIHWPDPQTFGRLV
jgi:hypothetical protein